MSSISPQPRRHSLLGPSHSRNSSSNTALNLLTSILGTSPVQPSSSTSEPLSFSSPPPSSLSPPPYTPSPPPTVLSTLPYMERAFAIRLSRSGINLPALELSPAEVEAVSSSVVPPRYVPPPPLFRHRATPGARFPNSQPSSRRGSIVEGGSAEEEESDGGGGGAREFLSYRQRARRVLVGEADPSPLLPPPPPSPSTESLAAQTPSPTEPSPLSLPTQPPQLQRQQQHSFATSLPSLVLQPTPSSSSPTTRRPHLPRGDESYSDRARRLLQEQAERAPALALLAQMTARREMERESEERMERMRRRSEGDDQRSSRGEGPNGGEEAAVSYAERARRMLVQREVRLRGFDEESLSGGRRSLIGA